MAPTQEFASATAPYCRPHMSAYARGRREVKGGQDPEYTRRLHLRRYGLTPETFSVMLAAQEGRCKICCTDDPGPSGWQVDHDHACCGDRKKSCGRCLRGILCTRCNIGIGNLQDDPAIVAAALAYLTEHRSRVASGAALGSVREAAQILPRNWRREWPVSEAYARRASRIRPVAPLPLADSDGQLAEHPHELGGVIGEGAAGDGLPGACGGGQPAFLAAGGEPPLQLF